MSRAFLSLPMGIKMALLGNVLALLFGAMTLFVVQRDLAKYLYTQLREKAEVSAKTHAESVARPLITGDILTLKEILRSHVDASSEVAYMLVLGPDGRLVARSEAAGAPAPPRPLSYRPLGRDAGPRVWMSREGEDRIFHAEAPILAGEAGTLRVGFTDARVRGVLRSTTLSFLFFLCLCLVGGQVLALGFSAMIVRPLDDLAKATRRIREGDLTIRAEIHADDELGRLARDFNEMAGAIEAHRGENLRLLERLVAVQEEERRRIARELHDHVGPSLSNVLLMTERLGGGASPATALLGEWKESVRGTIDEIRDLAFALRPPLLDDFGLEEALNRHVKTLRRHAEARIDFQFVRRGGPDRLPEGVETAFYRIASEALANALRHASAKTISLVVFSGEREASLLVEDDGTGFDPGRTGPATDAGGLGIIGMRERAALLGGECRIESSLAGGTTVRVTIPLPGRPS